MVSDYEFCIICGSPYDLDIHHLIEGTGKRDLSDKDGLTVYLCRDCHTGAKDSVHANWRTNRWSKICGQLAYERNLCAEGMTIEEAREDFRRRYGKSYL